MCNSVLHASQADCGYSTYRITSNFQDVVTKGFAITQLPCHSTGVFLKRFAKGGCRVHKFIDRQGYSSVARLVNWLYSSTVMEFLGGRTPSPAFSVVHGLLFLGVFLLTVYLCNT